MAKANFKLQSFDEMFKRTDTTEEETKTADTNDTGDTVAAPKKQESPKLQLHSLRKFKNHPFKAYTGDKLNELVESIKEHGILTPILVRPLSDEPDIYEIIAGHNRVNASKIAGIEAIPAVIRAMDDDTAAILMVESNFQQRQEISPSEKAFAYKIQLEALKRQGKRTDLTDMETSRQVGEKLSCEVVGNASNESARQIHRYIRLTELSPDLLQSVDENKIPFIPAVNISYLKEAEQQALSEILTEKNIKLSLSKSEALKNASAEQDLDRNVILDILEEEKQKSVGTVKTIKVPFKAVAEHFNGKSLTEKEMSDILIEALKLYYQSVSQEEILENVESGVISED